MTRYGGSGFAIRAFLTLPIDRKEHLIYMYVFFWVFPRRLIKIVVCRRFGTLYQFHLQRLDVTSFEDGTDRVFRNVGILQF